MNEEAASIFYNIQSEISNLEYSLNPDDDEKVTSEDVKWIISDIQGLLDDLLLNIMDNDEKI